jgi:hypothetical protein
VWRILALPSAGPTAPMSTSRRAAARSALDRAPRFRLRPSSFPGWRSSRISLLDARLPFRGVRHETVVRSLGGSSHRDARARQALVRARRDTAEPPPWRATRVSSRSPCRSSFASARATRRADRLASTTPTTARDGHRPCLTAARPCEGCARVATRQTMALNGIPNDVADSLVVLEAQRVSDPSPARRYEAHLALGALAWRAGHTARFTAAVRRQRSQSATTAGDSS